MPPEAKSLNIRRWQCHPPRWKKTTRGEGQEIAGAGGGKRNKQSHEKTRLGCGLSALGQLCTKIKQTRNK